MDFDSNKLDELLRTIRDNPCTVDPADRAFIESMITRAESGSRGVFAMIHPNGRMQFILLGAKDTSGAMGIIARVMLRLSEISGADA
jgi:hypothetical protein